MLISTLASVSGVPQQQALRKTEDKLQLAIASLVSGQRADDVANVAVATQLQSQTAGLKQVSQNLAQAGSLAQVADGAIARSQEIVGRLQEIAVQAQNDTNSAENRKALNQEFQALNAELDRQAAKTQFNGKNLLDGSLSGNGALKLNDIINANADNDGELKIDDLAGKALFDGEPLDVLTVDGAAKALEKLELAQGKLSTARASVGAFQQTLNFASASVDTAIVNQEAARSLLSDTDFLEAVSESQQAQVQRNAQLSLIAQTNRLPPALLQLIS